jgi:hypothetical protein
MKKVLSFLILVFGANAFCYSQTTEKTNQSPLFSTVVTARKMLDEHFALERGATYSFLSSRSEQTWTWGQQSTTNSEWRQQHFLGIPINLIIFLGNSSSNQWQFYFSYGFMVEMEVRSINKRVERTGTTVRTIIEKNSYGSAHFSLNGGFGVSYNLDKKWNIHFEPRIGCTYPTKYNTDRPFYFGLNLGLNYKIEVRCPPREARPVYDNNKIETPKQGKVVTVPSL